MLRHSSDSEPGYTRKRHGRYWQYFDEKGKRVTNRDEIDRLNAIALPPAYTDAWFCKDANGHIQATGKDARGRKQYRYHADYRAKQDASKYDGCREFGEALPKLRRRVEKDLKKRKLGARHGARRGRPPARLASISASATSNMPRKTRASALSTLRSRHLRRSGGKLKMRFTGKHGIVHEATITDSNLKRIVGKCQDLPGQMLFQYVNGDGEPQPITSSDVNDYIRDATGNEFTAKHFRTWGASVIFFDQLLAKGEERMSLKTVLEPVAEALGNTPTMSRKSYVHPTLIEALQDDPEDPLHGMERPRARRRLSSAETGFLKYLKRKPRRARRKAAA